MSQFDNFRRQISKILSGGFKKLHDKASKKGSTTKAG